MFISAKLLTFYHIKEEGNFASPRNGESDQNQALFWFLFKALG